jgi:prepilin-type processing-associated H-X9-DG protein
METLTAKLLDYLKGQSFQVAVAFTAVLVLTWLLRNRSAHVRYLLWLLVAIKCLTPPLVVFPVPVLPTETVSAVTPVQNPAIEHQSSPPTYRQSTNTELPITQVQPQPPTPIEDRQSKIENSLTTHLHLTSTEILLSMWAAGAACYLLWALGKAVRLGMQLKKIRRPLPAQLMIEQIEMLARLWDHPGGFNVWLVDGINQPFVWGLWRGAIYLPTRFQSIQTDKQKAIVIHEMAHVVRLDAFVNLIQILIQGVFWFHPLVWLANRAIRQEREKCCDEIAVARLGTAPKEYGSAIVDTLLQEVESTMTIPTLAVAGPVKNIEDRIKTIMQPGRRFFHRPSTIALLVIGALAAFVVPTTIALTQKVTPPDYALSGIVADANDKPIAGAIVFDDGYGPEPYQKGITDESGKFEYKSWNEEHNVAAKADGYQQQMMVFTTAPFDNSINLNFKLQKSSTPENAKINVVLRTISVPNDETQIQSLFDKAEISIPRFAMFVSQNNPDKQASGEATYGHTFLTAQDVEKLLKAVQSSPDAKLLTSPRLEINSGQSGIIQVQSERTAPEKKFLLHLTPSLTKDGILSQFTIISTDSVDIDKTQTTQTTHIRSNIVIPQDKTLLILGPDYYQESKGAQPAGPKPKGRMLILMEASQQPQAESIESVPDFKKRYFITIVVDKNNDISGPAQKVTLEQFEAMMRHYPDPAHTVLEVAFEPGAFPDIHTQYKNNPVFQKAGQWVEKYHLEYLSYVGEDRPENRRGPISIRTEDAFVMDKTIPVGMSAIGLNSDKPFLTVNSIQFSNKDFHFIADLQMSVISLPQRHWEIKVRLLDKDDKQLESVVNYYQNSKSNAFISDQTLSFDFGKEDLSQAAKFEIEVRLLTPNAERLDVYLVRQAAVACVHFAGKNGGRLPEKLEQIQPYLETEILLPLDKMEFLQAGRKMSEIKDLAATALLRMPLNDGKDGAIVAYCDGHVEYFPPERMKTPDYPDISLKPDKKSDVKIETIKPNPQFTATLPNGTRVELLGILRLTEKGIESWRPDGVPTTIEGVVESDIDGKSIVVAYRMIGEHVSFRSSIREKTKNVNLDAWFLSNSNIWLTDLPGERRYIDLYLENIESGPWKKFLYIPVTADELKASEWITKHGSLGVEKIGDFKMLSSTSFEVSIIGFQKKIAGDILAVDRADCMYRPSGARYDSQDRAELTYKFPPKDLAGFGQGEQDTGFIHFKNISLVPGQKSAVTIETTFATVEERYGLEPNSLSPRPGQKTDMKIEIQTTVEKERQKAMEQMRQTAMACIVFEVDNGSFPQTLTRLRLKPLYLPQDTTLPLDKMEFLQAGRKLSEIKDAATTALLRMQLNDGKDGAIIAYCDGHAEYFSPERMKIQEYPNVSLKPGKKTDAKVETVKEQPKVGSPRPETGSQKAQTENSTLTPQASEKMREEADQQRQIRLRMEQLAKALLDYAQAHDRNFPQQLSHLSKDVPDDLSTWAKNNIIYAGNGIYNNKWGCGVIACEKKMDTDNPVQGGYFIFNNGGVSYQDDKQAKELLLEIKSRTSTIDWTGPGLDEQAAKWDKTNGNAYRLMNNEKARTATAVAGPVMVMEKYLKQWPDMPQITEALNVLGCEYNRLGRADKARETFNRAIELARNANTPFINTLQINLAQMEIDTGQYEQARQRIEKVMALPVPDSLEDATAANAQLFIAPQALAQLYLAQGKEQQADELLKENARKAVQLAKENPTISWIPSYAVEAYRKRINWVLEKSSTNFPAAYALVDELEKALPGYQSEFPQQDLRNQIQQFENTTSLHPGQKTETKIETQNSGGGTNQPN